MTFTIGPDAAELVAPDGALADEGSDEAGPEVGAALDEAPEPATALLDTLLELELELELELGLELDVLELVALPELLPQAATTTSASVAEPAASSLLRRVRILSPFRSSTAMVWE